MTVGELIEALSEVPDDTPVKLGLQPRYPMVGRIMNICEQRNDDGDTTAVWIACSDNEDYGCPEGVWDETVIYDEKDE